MSGLDGQGSASWSLLTPESWLRTVTESSERGPWTHSQLARPASRWGWPGVWPGGRATDVRVFTPGGTHSILTPSRADGIAAGAQPGVSSSSCSPGSHRRDLPRVLALPSSDCLSICLCAILPELAITHEQECSPP